VKITNNPLKKINQQIRKWPKTKTKKIITQLLRKPATTEKESPLRDMFMQNVHVDFDHIY